MAPKNKILIFIVFLLCAGVYVFVLSRTEYRIDGDMVYVKASQATTTLRRSNEFTQRVYLLVGEGLPENDYYHASLPVISMGTVEALTLQYGDFRKCVNAGSSAGKESTVHIRLIGIDDNVAKKIAAVYTRSRDRKDALIKVDGADLQMLEHIMRSNTARSLDSLVHEDILVRDIEVVNIAQ